MPEEFVAEIDPSLIVSVVCEALALDPVDIKGSRRFIELSDARSIANSLIRKHTDLTLKQTARFMQRGDHSTIIGSLKRHDELLFSCAVFRSKVELVKNALREKGYDC